MRIVRAVAANTLGTDVMIHFDDGSIAAAKPDDRRLLGIAIEPCGSAVAAAGRMISKADLYRRLTDPELEAFDQHMREHSTLRQRLNFEAQAEIDKTDIHWRSIMMVLFGSDRAERILA